MVVSKYNSYDVTMQKQLNERFGAISGTHMIICKSPNFWVIFIVGLIRPNRHWARGLGNYNHDHIAHLVGSMGKNLLMHD